ncbi:MAG: hypothetical protein CMF74_06115 [Maricaulis sp.]|jgi:hypothetical protein|nr:hypothetical protein [Maricaulis sp.]HAQ35736.1 hypothetical protein [Alphaproteobacteria bacterium]|tara:strand:+ start:2025 stop:2393 length:369 start_codon:yes stop_codon:yes gene_type:complete
MKRFIVIASAMAAAAASAAPANAAGWEIRGLTGVATTADCIARAHRIMTRYSQTYYVSEIQRGSIGVYMYGTDNNERDATIQCSSVDRGGEALLIVHDTRNDTDIAVTAERIVQYWDATGGK